MSYFKKLTVFLLILSLFSVSLLTGCRQKDPNELPKDYSGVELTYYKVFDSSDLIEPIITKYEDSHPGLVIHYKKFANYSEYEKTILNEMAEGEGPDIFSMQNTWFISNYKKISPLPDEMGLPSAFASTFVDVAYKDLVRPDEEGIEKIYGLPMTVDTLALYYNKDHFEDRIPAKGKPSSTWEGIKEDVTLLNKTDTSFDRFEVSGIAMGRSDNISRAVDILYLLFLQYGTEFYNENISEAIFAGKQGGEVYSYPAVEALSFFVSFAKEDFKHYSWNEFVVSEDSEAQEIEAFARGDVSMIIGYSYTYDLILNSIDALKADKISTINKDSIGIAPIPQLFDPDVSNDKRVTYASYFAETVSRNSKYPDTAWDFLIFLTSNENLDYYFKETNKPTSRRDMIEDQKKDPIFGVFASQIGYAESFPVLDYDRYKEIFSSVITAAFLRVDLDTILLEAQVLINNMVPTDGILVPKKTELEKEDSAKKDSDKKDEKEN